jgi:hypothetical protein
MSLWSVRFLSGFFSSSLINWHPIPTKRLNKFKIIHHRPIAYDCIQCCKGILKKNPDHFDDFDAFFGQNLAKWLVWQLYSLPLLHVRYAEKWLPSLRCYFGRRGSSNDVISTQEIYYVFIVHPLVIMAGSSPNFYHRYI